MFFECFFRGHMNNLILNRDFRLPDDPCFALRATQGKGVVP